MQKNVFGAIVGLTILVGLSVFIFLLTGNRVVFGYNDGYKPTQPIPFSHQLHAGQYQINCNFCHTTAATSRHASVPSLNVCMNCHLTTKADSPFIQQISKAYNEGTNIEWQKVHLLPDFVKFDHKAHIRKGKQCQECHGPVETMPVVYQWSSLSMGWCIECHRRPENNAATTCASCHY